MDTLRPYPPGADRDTWMGNWSDEVELFLQPTPRGRFYFHFTADCAASQFEALSDADGKGGNRSGPTWTEPWRAAATRQPDAYLVEMAVPFASLVRPGYLAQRPGETVWHAQFSRMTSYSQEASSWSGGDERKIGKAFGGHDTDDFGVLIFAPPKEKAVFAFAVAGQAGAGRDAIRLLCQGKPEDDVQAEAAVVVRDAGGAERTLWKETVRLPASQIADSSGEIPYVPIGGGRGVLEVKVRGAAGRVLQAMRVPLTGPAFDQWFAQAKQEAQTTTWRLRKEPSVPGAQSLLERAAALERRAAALAAQFEPLLSKKQTNLDGWAKLQVSSESLQAETQKLARDTVEARAAAASKLKEPWAGIGWQSALVRYRPEDAFRGEIGTPVRITVCRNEYRGAQVVLIPLRQGLQHVSAAVGNLRCVENGMELPLGSAETEVVGFVQLQDTPASGKPGSFAIAAGEYPDPLMKTEQDFALKPGRLQPLYLRVYGPQGALPGLYRGEVRAAAEGQPGVLKLGIEVQLLDFDLPNKHSIAYWPCDVSALAYWYYYGEPAQGGIHRFMNLTTFKHYADFMQRYRCDISLEQWAHRVNQSFAVEYLGKKGGMDQFAFDFSLPDPYLQIIFDRHTRFFSLSAPTETFISQNFTRFAARDRATGKLLQFDYKDKRSEEATETLLQFLEQYLRHLKEKGWYDPDYTVYYGFDEAAYQASLIPRMQEVHRRVKERLPGLKRTYSAAEPSAPFNEGYIDIWAPRLGDSIAGWAAAERAKGRGVWCNNCGGETSINVRLSKMRASYWLMRKWGITGHLCYAFNLWVSGGIQGAPPWNRWPARPWTIRPTKIPADSYLAYPSPDGGEPWSSLRMEAMRDGIQDYEYFALAEALLRRLEKRPDADAALLARLKDRSKVPEDIGASCWRLTDDAELIEQHRIRLGEAIEQAARALRQP